MEKQSARTQLAQLSRANDVTEDALVDYMRTLFTTRVLSQGEIADVLGVRQSSVSRMLKRHVGTTDVALVPEQGTAQQLVYSALAGDVDHDALVERLHAWPWDALYRSKHEADDTENGPNTLMAAYLARNLKLISEDELDSILDAAVSHG